MKTKSTSHIKHPLHPEELDEALRKFMDGNTTVDEERAIAKWFREHPKTSPELDDYRTMFEWFDEGMPLDDDKNIVLKPKKHRRWLWISISAVAAAAIITGILFNARTVQMPNLENGDAVIAVKAKDDSTATTAADTRTGTIEQHIYNKVKTDTIKPQINQKERRHVRKSRRIRFEPVPPPVLYAQNDNDSLPIAKADIEQAEQAVDVLLGQMEEEQRQIIDSYNLRFAAYEQIVTAAIEDDYPEEDDYYDGEIW